MNPDRFRECLALLHWTQRGVAAILGVDERRVRRWATGVYPIPVDVAAWLELLAHLHARNPPPCVVYIREP